MYQFSLRHSQNRTYVLFVALPKHTTQKKEKNVQTHSLPCY